MMENKKEKIRELVSYLIVGVLTTVVSFGTYFLLTLFLLDPEKPVELQIANVISWICAVIFAYFTNRKYVFRSKEKNMLKEGSKFCLSRVFTLLLDMLTMFIMVSVFHINDRISKLVAQVIITVGNYIISKLFVFNKKERKLGVVGKTLLLLIASYVVGSVLLILVYMLPVTRMKIHADDAAVTFQKEGTYPMVITRYQNTQLDNYTDAIIINEAIFESKDSVIDKAMHVYRNKKDEPIPDLLNTVWDKEKDFTKADYSRYWHGNIVPIKLLLLIFDYSQIRIINIFIETIMIMFIFYLMNKQGLIRNVFDLFVSLFMIFPFIIGLSLQFSSVYLIFLVGIILMLKFNLQLKDKYIYFFMLMGIVTSYMDLLTFPILPLGMGLLFNMLMNKKDSLKDNIIEIFKYSLFWGIGYFGMWAGKWLVGSLLCKDNFFKIAFEAVKYRMGNGDVSRLHSVYLNIKVYLNRIYMVMLLPIICYYIYRIVKNRKNITKINILNCIPYILIALVPIIWLIVTSQHAEMHFWFTNKSLVVSIFAGLLLLNNLSLSNEK